MKLEKFLEIWEAYHDEEFLKFERIKNPLHPRHDICAFLLLHNLVGGKGDMVCNAAHDEIWLDVNVTKLAKVATEEDIVTLIRCGVMYDDDEDSLAMFV